MTRLWILSLALLGSVAARDLDSALDRAGDRAPAFRSYLDWAESTHGPDGRRTAKFLVTHMPEADLRSLDAAFLRTNHELAFRARSEFPWAAAIPDEVFRNDVLPYASLDESRENWRAAFYEKAKPLVKDCRTTTEAAQALNRGFFDLINVHYDTGRKRPNQSPSESIELQMASCTGLSIILVDACRAVGVPARIAGIPVWPGKGGNHTWVEIWDDGEWHFTGADEYDPRGLNRAWFTGDAAAARADDWKHAIWATSWRRTGAHFPLVWNPRDRSVPAVNVTGRYAKTTPTSEGTPAHQVFFRMLDARGGERIAAELRVDLDGDTRSFITRAGRKDRNDMPGLAIGAPGETAFEASFRGATRAGAFTVSDEPRQTVTLHWDELEAAKPAVGGFADELEAWMALPPEDRRSSAPERALTRTQTERATHDIWNLMAAEAAAVREGEIASRVVRTADLEMKLLEETFGDAEPGARSLWISLHGGGGAPARVNERQWQNQIRLYQPGEGIVVAPRAPTDTWNLWHRPHVDRLLDRLIENYVIARGVHADRVYLMGYSAGGDGIYQLAPRMADRFAAASMMAGHPNDASPLGLRNLPFRIFMGGKDAAYKRNAVAAKWGEKLENLRDADPRGYPHEVTIYDDLGHWMDGRDAEALPWMAKHTRDPWPTRVVWNRHKKLHTRFYWLEIPDDADPDGGIVRAAIDGQTVAVRIDGELERIRLRLHDHLLDLDRPLRVTVNGAEIFEGKVERSIAAIRDSLESRLDPESVATSILPLSW